MSRRARPAAPISRLIKLLEHCGPMRYAEDASLENFRPDGWGIGHRVMEWGGPYFPKKTCHLCGSPNNRVTFGGRTCDVCLKRLQNQVRFQKELVDF